MLVKDVMSRKVRSITPETTIAEVMSMMRFYHCDGLPVAVNNKLVGYIEHKDVIEAFFPETGSSDSTEKFDIDRIRKGNGSIARETVQEIMNKNKKSISPLTHINEVISMMLEDNVCHLAVTEGDRLVGTVGFDDINKAILSLASTKVAA